MHLAALLFENYYSFIKLIIIQSNHYPATLVQMSSSIYKAKIATIGISLQGIVSYEELDILTENIGYLDSVCNRVMLFAMLWYKVKCYWPNYQRLLSVIRRAANLNCYCCTCGLIWTIIRYLFSKLCLSFVLECVTFVSSKGQGLHSYDCLAETIFTKSVRTDAGRKFNFWHIIV